jgi:hypothetical protein
VLRSEQNRKKCTYAWALLDCQTQVAHHRGAVQGHQHQGSNRSELIGIQTALKRIETTHRNWSTSPTPKMLTIWTANESVARILEQLRYRLTTATTAIEDEAKAKLEIGQMLESHPGYQVKTINAQTDTIIKESSVALEERINASENFNLRTTIPSERAKVMLGQEQVTTDIQTTLRTESTKIQYHKYLRTKYSWNRETIHKIDWEALAQAMAALPSRLHKTTKQFTHGWLPTNGHPGANEPKTTFCPRCNQERETNKHFLICPRDRTLWADKFMNNNNSTSEPQVHKILIQTIGNLLNNQQINVPAEYQQIAELQTEIGWQQLLNGRWTKQWAQTYNDETETTEGTEWAANQMRKIWRHIHDRWKERCAMEHNDEAITNANQHNDLNCRLRSIYNQQNNLEEMDRRIFKRTIEEMQELTIAEKAAWIARTRSTIAKGIKRVRHRRVLTNNTITRYFKTRHQTAQQETPKTQGNVPTSGTTSPTGNRTDTSTRTRPIQESTVSTTNIETTPRTRTSARNRSPESNGRGCSRNQTSKSSASSATSTSTCKSTRRGTTKTTRTPESQITTAAGTNLTTKKKTKAPVQVMLYYDTPRISSLRKFRRNPKTQKENLDPP